tara:strand:- start:251 stop:1537 length:1287 start_codon:yes stop_codon:yes gene_type:complete
MSQFIFPPLTASLDSEAASGAALPVKQMITGGYHAGGSKVYPIAVDADGQLQVDVVSSMPLPSGAATEAKQDTMITDLTNIETYTNTIQGAVSGTEMQVDVVAALPGGTNSIGTVILGAGTAEIGKLAAGTASIGTVILGAGTAEIGKLAAGTASIGSVTLNANSGVDIGDVDVTSIIPGVGATNLGKAIQSAQGVTDTGVPALVVRNDTLADLSGADGDYAPIQVNDTGAVYTVLSAGTAVFGKLAANSGVDIGDVDVTSSALPTGAATSALQTTANGILTTIDADTSLVAGCVAGTELQVDVVSGSVVVDTYSVVDFIDSTVAGYVADNGVIELSGTDTIPAKAASQLQLVASSAAAIKKIQTVEDIGEYMGIFTGASTAETLACVLPLGGGEVSVEIASSTRISIRALTSGTAITSGSLGINFLG